MSELGYFGDDRKDTFRKQIIELEKRNAAQAEHIAELERIIAKHIYDESHGQRIDSE